VLKALGLRRIGLIGVKAEAGTERPVDRRVDDALDSLPDMGHCPKDEGDSAGYAPVLAGVMTTR